ncbi:hypothetical protein TrLO_g12698 [Triparma laevis f. longispina]|uniref:Uncharacterized protein n=1 Tax=Triparma laevis f. longispina TaxID=1714387 RepID=A0A9W7ACP7_9STRA|nr:hypothetical protein TrLO_g12698 [Triparma laevis f. longispina]
MEETKRNQRRGEMGLGRQLHPRYLPFDLMTTWICEDLLEKYENKSVERPKWMAGKGNEAKFINCVVEIHTWKDEDEIAEKVNKALDKLFGKSGADLENAADGLSLSFIPSKNSNKNLRQIELEP